MSEPAYHVGCGAFDIYAGTWKKQTPAQEKEHYHEWRNKSCATKEALNAVADYLYMEEKEVHFSIKGKKYVLKVEEVKEMNNDAMLQAAKELAANAINDSEEKCGITAPVKVTADDMYVVWFCKTLQNWKALVSTDKIHSGDVCGDYVEVTHNGDKSETYCDVYKKALNICYHD